MKFIKYFFECILNGIFLSSQEAVGGPPKFKKAYIGIGIMLIIVVIYFLLFNIFKKFNISKVLCIIFPILIIMSILLLVFILAIIVEKIFKL